MSDTLEKFEFITIHFYPRPMIFEELLSFKALSDSKATHHLKVSLQPHQITRIWPAFQNKLSRMSLVKKAVEKNLWSL